MLFQSSESRATFLCIEYNLSLAQSQNTLEQYSSFTILTYMKNDPQTMWIIVMCKYFLDQIRIFLSLVFLYLHDSECIYILSKWSVFVLGVGTGQCGSILMQKLFWSKLVAAPWLRGSNLANVITDQHERPLINIQNANIHKMQIFTKFQQLADNLFYPAVCLDELTIQTPVIPYRINSRFFVYFYLYLRSFVTVFVILCVQLCKDCW